MAASTPPTSHHVAKAAAAVKAWQHDNDVALPCFSCADGRLTVTNASVMPYAEWYLLDCTACGHRTTHHHMIGRPRLSEEI